MYLIAGPCVIESEKATLEIAERLVSIVGEFQVDFVFKASFDKANRTSLGGYRGVGFNDGLDILKKVKDKFKVKITTDIHACWQAEDTAEICDVIQIPALLARQTDLIVAAAETQRIVNIKKGQFMAPEDMGYAVQKVKTYSNNEVWLTERGTCFGYNRLINDFTGLPIMRQWGKVIFDATHSVQQPNSLNGSTGGNRKNVELLAKAANAVGVDGLFFEVHPDPDNAPSDGPNMIPLDQFKNLLENIWILQPKN